MAHDLRGIACEMANLLHQSAYAAYHESIMCSCPQERILKESFFTSFDPGDYITIKSPRCPNWDKFFDFQQIGRFIVFGTELIKDTDENGELVEWPDSVYYLEDFNGELVRWRNVEFIRILELPINEALESFQSGRPLSLETYKKKSEWVQRAITRHNLFNIRHTPHKIRQAPLSEAKIWRYNYDS